MTKPQKERSELGQTKAERRLRAQVEAAGAVAWFCAPSGLVVEPQAAWMAFTGQTAEENLGEGWTKAIHPQDLPSILRKWREALARASPVSSEMRVRRYDGEWRWMSVRAAPIRDESGEIVEWCAVNIDITDRKRAEEALRESEERLRRVSDNAEVGLTRCSRDWIYLSVNPAYAKIIGAPIDQILYRPIAEVKGAKAAEAIRPYVERVLRGENVTFEAEVPINGSARRWLSVQYTPDTDAAGTIFGWIACVTDITDRKEAEAALRESEERFRLFMDNSPAVGWMKDEEGRLVYLNRSYEERLCIRMADCLGKTDAELWPPEVAAEFRQNDLKVLEGGHPIEIIEEAREPGGGKSYWLSTKFLFRDAAGKRYVGGIGLDITERKQMEAALRDADRAKDEFLATLAHELRNPLASICNGLEGLRQLGAQDFSVDHLLASMDGQAGHLIRLIDDLMDISRIRRGKFELQKKRMDLAAALTQAVDMSRHLFAAGGLDLHLNFPPTPMPVDGDAVRLTQVFANLLNNAAKFTKRGGRVEIALERVGDEAVVSVTDTGLGVSKELLPHIFDPFRQGDGKAGELKQGLGIGLALVRNITEMHGGAVEARSDGEGLGSSFIVRLPLLEGATTEAPVPQSAPARLGAGRRVLVIDDLPDVAQSLAFLLKILGADVRIAHSGAQGLAICAEFEPELVFLDLAMPEMDGFETARRMREFPAGRRAKLVGLSGFGEERWRARTKEAGFDGYLPKPARLSQLEELLASERGETAQLTTAS